MEFNELKSHEKETLDVDGEIFTFVIDFDLGGEWAIWESSKHRVYATLNYECRGVPVSIEDLEGNRIGDEGLEGEIDNFEEYKTICKTLIRKILSKKT